MADVKPLNLIQEKWARVTPQRIPDYQQGVANPRRDWKASALAARETYKTAVIAAANQGMFEKGVERQTSEAYKAITLAKGPQRFADGVQVGQGAYLKGVTPYIEVIKSTTLPPRYAKGDPRNIQRVTVLATALNARRRAGI